MSLEKMHTRSRERKPVETKPPPGPHYPHCELSRIYFLFAYFGLKQVAKDRLLKCQCGEPPNTDGATCAKCFAQVMLEVVQGYVDKIGESPKPKRKKK